MNAFHALVVCAAVGLAAPPSARADEPVVAGENNVPAPKRTKTVQPTYPAEAQARGLRGIVIVELVIDTQGKVSSAQVVRSIPPFDEAALAAVRQWEYEVTKVDGKPVSVKLTVPITFAMKVPEIAARQEGIPELRTGAFPPYPPETKDPASATAEVTLGADGTVEELRLLEGPPAFGDALVRALRTWRFAPDTAEATVTFRVRAQFVPAARGAASRVEFRLDSLRRSESVQTATAAPSSSGTPTAAPAGAPAPPQSPATAPATAPPASAPPASAPPASAPPPTAPPATAPPAAAPPAAAPPAAAPPAAAPPPTAPPATAPPATAPPAAGPPTTAAPTSPGAVTGPATAKPAPPAGAPPATAPPATPTAAPPAPVGPAATSAKPTEPGAVRPTQASAEPQAAAKPPAMEVLNVPPPALPPENGLSAIRDVTLAPGVPDLTRGRRPVPPPFARMAEATGTVEVTFSVDAAGIASVKGSTGPDVFKRASEQTVASWTFRRTRVDRIFLVADFKYGLDAATAAVRPDQR